MNLKLKLVVLCSFSFDTYFLLIYENKGLRRVFCKKISTQCEFGGIQKHIDTLTGLYDISQKQNNIELWRIYYSFINAALLSI